MIRFIRRLLGRGPCAPDPEAFFGELRGALPDGYTKTDRHRDFHAVFMGTSTPEQGRRVLWEILGWTGMYRRTAVKGDAHETYFREGKRNVGLQILTVVNSEPKDRSQKARSQARA